jgi:hypothetical protein
MPKKIKNIRPVPTLQLLKDLGLRVIEKEEQHSGTNDGRCRQYY